MSVSKKILIVDDSKVVLSLHSNIIKKLGFDCSSAENGFLALEYCLKTQFDLVITDVNMPKMDGYEFTKKLRSFQGYSETPIIMVSTEQEAQDKTLGIEAGVDVYIVKPVDAEKLEMHLKILLRA